jgi:hypothetical protein
MPRTVSVPYEQIPGASTGLAPHLLSAPPETKLAFSRAAQWADEAGRDKLFRTVGIEGEPTVEAPGYFKNAAGVAENNPTVVAHSTVESGASGWSENSKRLHKFLAKIRNLADFQEGGGAFTITPDPRGASLHIAMDGLPHPDQMRAIGDVAQAFGLIPANTADGVALLNPAKNMNPQMVAWMKRDIERQLRDIAPKARIGQVRHEDIYVDSAKLLAKENEGLGMATEDFVNDLLDLKNRDPKAYEGIAKSKEIQAKAAANLERLNAYGGLGQRVDYENFLGRVAKDGVQGLVDYVEKYGYKGLPAVIGGAAVPVILGNDGSTNER